MFLEALLSISFLVVREEDWPPNAEELERGLPDGAHYHAAYAATSEPGFVVTFFSMYGSGGQTFFARRQPLAPSTGLASWASASDCPALYAALDWLTDIRPPALAVNGLRRLPDGAEPYDLRPRRGPVADGPTYWISGSGWGTDGSLVHVTFSSSGGYVADWGAATTRHLAPCWRDDAPSWR